MKAHIRISLLVSLLAAFMFFGFLSSGKEFLGSKDSTSTTEDLPIYLDGELLGSVDNTQPLESRFRALEAKIDARQGNLNYNVGPRGGLLNIGRIILYPDERLSAGQFEKVWKKTEEFFEYPSFERMALWSGGSCEKLPQPRPAVKDSIFVLSNSPLSSAEQERIRDSERCGLHAEVYTTDQSPYSRRQAKSFRVSASSIEISDIGSYFLNEQAANPQSRVSPIANLASPNFRRRLDAAKIKQRPIGEESLEKEVRSWIEKRIAEGSDDLVWDESGLVVLPIIINKKASYSSLLRVLRLVSQPKIRVMIVIDDPPGR
ncbi:MAG: hypothetical protein ABIR33_12230 [Pyrinomonadaceae bacterium]